MLLNWRYLPTGLLYNDFGITLPTTDNNKLLMPLKPFSIDFITRLFDEGLLWLFPEFFGGFNEGSSEGAKIKTNTQCRIFVKFVAKTVSY